MPKGIFIGLGGTGLTTLAKLKARLFHDTYESNMDAMKNECRFIFYDTDAGSKSKTSSDPELSRLMGDDYFAIDEDEYITAATVNPYSRYKGAKTASASDLESQRMLEWMIDPDVTGHVKLENKELGQGAGANRIKGRVGIMSKFGEFERKIKAAVDGLSELDVQGANQEVQRPHIWVFASSNGGTSSSALLDVLYLANRVYRDKYQSNPYLRLVLYMPKPFINVNKNSLVGYTLNGYATLWELNAFRYDRVKGDDGGKKFGTFAVRPDPTSSWSRDPWPVCSYVMAIDLESKAGKLKDIDQMIDNTANLCYFLHSGSVGESMVSKLDNDYDEDKDFYTQFKQPKDEKFGWSYFVVGSGYKTLTKADDFLKEYVRKRFRYDLFGSGLLGLRFDVILPNKEEQSEAARKFANDYILKHLINVDNYSQSSEATLYGVYKTYFNAAAGTPLQEGDSISKQDWEDAGTELIRKCSDAKSILKTRFSDSEKDKVLKNIIDSVCEGVDRCVIEYGLNYTYSLLNMVDDDFLEKIVLGKLERKPNIEEKKKAIEDASQKNRRRAENVKGLIDAMDDYRNACVEYLALENICEIITEITQKDKGLLEYLRKGDGSHKGILGLQRAFGQSFVDCKTDFDRLAVSFKDTKKEPCTEYFPCVSDMVDEKSAWVRKNVFEELYACIVPLDTAEDAKNYEDKNHGCPPKRDRSVTNGLAYSIEMVKQDETHPNLFADLALSDEITFRELRERLERHIDDYVNQLLTIPSGVLTWLGYKLEEVFDARFTKEDGTKDKEALKKYISDFKANIPVFYPVRSDRTAEVLPQDRYLYVGATEDFAKKMGYSSSDEQQYLQDPNLQNQLLVCKLEVGHNFYDYKYFDDLKDEYEKRTEIIRKGGSGCHIHKNFVTRDINRAYEMRKVKRFEDFIKLCWFDSYFELLNKYPSTKEMTEAIFGIASSIILDSDSTGKTTNPKKKSDKLLDGEDDFIGSDDDLLGEDLLDEGMGDLDLMEDTTESEDLSTDLSGYDDEMEMEESPIELGLSPGYRPIVVINSDLSVVIKALKKSEMAGILAFAEEEDVKEKSIFGQNLVQIRKKIINNLDEVEYAKMYFANFSAMFNSFNDETRKKLIMVHKVYKDKVKELFIKKIRPILQKKKSHDIKDGEVFDVLNRIVMKLIGKDIFK